VSTVLSRIATLSRIVLGATLGVLALSAHADLILSPPLSTVDLLNTPLFNRTGMPAGLAQTVEVGATLSANVPGTVTYTYIGSESGFINQFFTNTSASGTATFTTPGSTNMIFVTCAAPCTPFSFSTGGGTLAFSFRSPSGSAVNGVDGAIEPNFGIWLQNPDTAYFYFNDGSGDRDFNDMIVRANFAPGVGAVPEPHTVALVFAGLVILGIIARRRTRK
jgi:PEP-CTERM motif